MKTLIIIVLYTLYVHAQSDWRVAQEDLKKLAVKERNEIRVEIIRNTITEMKSEQLNFETLRFDTYKLFYYGKESIPFLLDAGFDTTIIGNMLRSTYSSLEFTDHIRRGSLFLNLIDYIVLKDTLILCQQIPDPISNYISLSFRGVLTGPSHKELITVKELQEVVELYKKWWSKVSKLSLEDIKAGWKKGNTPLKNSGFGWD